VASDFGVIFFNNIRTLYEYSVIKKCNKENRRFWGKKRNLQFESNYLILVWLAEGINKWPFAEKTA